MRRVPVEALLCQLAGGRRIDGGEMEEPSEVFRGFLFRLRYHRDVEFRSDDLSNGFHWDLLFCSAMKTCSRLNLFILQGQSVQSGGVESMNRVPAVGAISD